MTGGARRCARCRPRPAPGRCEDGDPGAGPGLVGADRLTATVIGGGVAGLASAVALAQAGWRVTVLERAPVFAEVGAGVGARYRVRRAAGQRRRDLLVRL